MKAILKFWTVLLCAGLVLGGCCDDPITPEVPDTGDDDNPPVEQPDKPVDKPLTDNSLFTIQLNDDIMATVGTNPWNSIAYGNNRYVAVGTDEIAYSSNGTSWTRKSLNLTSGGNIHIIRYLNGQFIAKSRVGSSYDFTWLQSKDGLNWQKYSAAPYSNSASLSITYGDGLYVAISGSDKNQLTTSKNGTSWITYEVTGLGSKKLNDIVYGKDKFVIVRDSDDSSYGSIGYVSLDEGDPSGLGEVTYVPCKGNIYEKVVYGNNKFVALSSGKSAVSSNGVDWEFFDLPEESILGSSLEDMTYGNGFFVGISKNEALYSIDGITWSKVKIDALNINYLNCVIL